LDIFFKHLIGSRENDERSNLIFTFKYIEEIKRWRLCWKTCCF